VRNDDHGVHVEAEGHEEDVAALVAALSNSAPPLAVVDRVETRRLEVVGGTGFRIVTSEDRGGRRVSIAADVATCAECLREMFDPDDRRHRYAFTNCTNCGPRYTITRDVPYDRNTTTMRRFPLCGECTAEYLNPLNRRFHAEATCCRRCGPRLSFTDARGRPVTSGDPIDIASAWLQSSRLVAIKGVGGYHLAALAADDAAVATLRARKHRHDKPFALLAPDLEWASRLVHTDPEAERLLTAPAAPIVLLPRRVDAPVADGVAPASGDLGILLPYTPVHHLLADALKSPVVLTSGNVADEPIVHDDHDARRRLGPIVDGFLGHDRAIHVRCDDSVTTLAAGRPVLLRRSRGYAPLPLRMPVRFARPVLACGAELKHTFAIARDTQVTVSHHLGDLKTYETYRAFVDGVAHFERIFGVAPQVVAHDLHPDYLSTKHALESDVVELVGVQHHHAHIASCLADNHHLGRVIGVAFDGVGYGTDGTMWGGEFLLADLSDFERVGWLRPVPMPGGDAAVRQPWRMAAAYLDAALGAAVPPVLPVVARNADRWQTIVDLGRTGLGSPLTSSAGRLFDGVAAIVDVRDAVSYEGQAASELEQLADPTVVDDYPVRARGGPPFELPGPELVACVVDDVLAGTSRGVVSARFHRTVAAMIVDTCERIRDLSGLSTVALSGGVFQNRLLLALARRGLAEAAFEVLVHSRVPPNDGGISLGQALVAGVHDGARPAA
jgi:hydrogenase maturation protein HypF